MNIEQLRYSSGPRDTLGIWMGQEWAGDDWSFLCYTLEDEYRYMKLPGKTRIPSGSYRLALRTHGGFHKRYLERFGAKFHKGMIEILDVEDFSDVLVHCGNDHEDTEGCVLTGDIVRQNVTAAGFIGNSENAYKRVYPLIAQKLLDGNEEVWLQIIDFDGTPTLP